jgi:hypothetical protein
MIAFTIGNTKSYDQALSEGQPKKIGFRPIGDPDWWMGGPAYRLANVMRARAAGFVAEPPPATWTGVYVMETK